MLACLLISPGYLPALQVLILVIYPTPKTGKKQPPDPIVHPILFKEILVMLFSGPPSPPPSIFVHLLVNGSKEHMFRVLQLQQ